MFLLYIKPIIDVSFNFNQKKETGVKTIMVGDKTIVEAVVQKGGKKLAE